MNHLTHELNDIIKSFYTVHVRQQPNSVTPPRTVYHHALADWSFCNLNTPSGRLSTKQVHPLCSIASRPPAPLIFHESTLSVHASSLSLYLALILKSGTCSLLLGPSLRCIGQNIMFLGLRCNLSHLQLASACSSISASSLKPTLYATLLKKQTTHDSHHQPSFV